MKLTDKEIKAVKSAIRSAITLNKHFTRPEILTAYAHEPKTLKRIKSAKTKLTTLKSAFVKIANGAF